MKTAISIPDPLFQWFEELSKKQNVSRSKLYATALADYRKRIAAADLTEQANRYAEDIDKNLEQAVHRSGKKAWANLD